MNKIVMFTEEEFNGFIKRMVDKVSHSKATPNQRSKMMAELTDIHKIAHDHENEEIHKALKNRVESYRRTQNV